MNNFGSFAAAMQCAYEASIIDSDVAVSINEGITANSHRAAVEYKTERSSTVAQAGTLRTKSIFRQSWQRLCSLAK